jgi:hypothetical protein
MRLILVHGLGRTPLSMWALHDCLGRAGHAASLFSYMPWAESYERIRDRLAGRLSAIDATGQPWAAIGHSLGGLLLRDAISLETPRHLAHLFMLGTPNRPPRLAPRAMRIAPFRWLSGQCGERLASPEYFARLPVPACPCTVVTGTRGFYGRRSPFGEEINDGIVAQSEALLGSDGAHYAFPIAHTFMMNRRAVQRLVLETLRGASAQVAA